MDKLVGLENGFLLRQALAPFTSIYRRRNRKKRQDGLPSHR